MKKFDGLEDETVMGGSGLLAEALKGDTLQAVVVGASMLDVHPLPETGKVTIGRYHGSGIAIDDDSISRFHAVLNLGPPHTIEDVGSKSGTFVDGVQLRPGQKAPIHLGTAIKVGTVLMVVQKKPRR